MPNTVTGMFPSTPEEMDVLLGFEGTRKPDGVTPPTPGRSKVVWKPAAGVTIVYEEHPYDTNAPAYHKGLHWHLTSPTGNHVRYLPGAPFPNW